MNKRVIVKSCSWLLSGLVGLLAVIVWGGERLDGRGLTAYDWFPLLGLLAFSLMWTHYVVGALRRAAGLKVSVNKLYLKITSVVVLVLIILHPALLIIQLNKDDFGFPPDSYLKVYGEPAMKLAIMLGTISLLIFLSFEFKKLLEKKRWWKFVEYAQIAAMGFIFYHGLPLGRELAGGWYRTVWYLYGISLAAAVIYNIWYDKSTKKEG